MAINSLGEATTWRLIRLEVFIELLLKYSEIILCLLTDHNSLVTNLEVIIADNFYQMMLPYNLIKKICGVYFY